MYSFRRRRYKNGCHQHGFTLQEVLISASVIAIAVSFSIPKVLEGMGGKDLAVKRNSSFQEVTEMMKMATNDSGLLPTTFGPGQILTKYSRYRAVDPAIINPPDENFIGVCPTRKANGEKTFIRADGVVITNVSDSWLLNPDADGDNDPNNVGDTICVALKGVKSQTFGKDAYWLFYPRRMGKWEPCPTCWPSIGKEVAQDCQSINPGACNPIFR